MALLKVKTLEGLRAGNHGDRLNDDGGIVGWVHAAKTGAVSVRFEFSYKRHGKKRTVHLGTWPKTSLADIRIKRDAIKGELASGLDVVEERAKARQAEQEAEELRKLQAEADHQQSLLEQRQRLEKIAQQHARLSVRDLADLWLRLEVVNRADKGREVARILDKNVFPLIGDMAVEDVQRRHIQELIDRMKLRATPEFPMIRASKVLLGTLRQMFNFAVDREHIDTDPTSRIKKHKLGQDTERERYLAEGELVELLQKMPTSGLAETSQLALLLQLATGARIREVLGSRWQWVDTERRLWSLPTTKNGRPHEIWLSDFALGKLQRLRAITGETEWLFPSHSDLRRALHPQAVQKQVHDRQIGNGLRLAGRTKQTAALVLPGGRWTTHDLRRTCATMMTELGVLPEVAEKCLNHREENKVKRIYQRASYAAPMREAWRLWGDRLDLLQSQAAGEATNITTLQARSA